MNTVSSMDEATSLNVHGFVSAYRVDPSDLAGAVELFGEHGLDLVLMGTVGASHLGYLAGDARERARALEEASRSAAQVAWAARGGFGTIEILRYADIDVLAVSKKIWVGCSDLSGLLNLLATRGVLAVHGPLLKDVAFFDPAVTLELFELLRRLAADPSDLPSYRWLLPRLGGPSAVLSAPVEGLLFGGNLTTLVSFCAPRLFGGGPVRP